MAYMGPERRRSVQTRTDYDVEYGFARSAAANWPPGKLRGALNALMSFEMDCEAIWATIDAFSDLLLEQIDQVWPAPTAHQ